MLLLVCACAMQAAAAETKRLPLFPELRRFPASFAEMSGVHAAILLPSVPREVHLRGVAILGARLGQLSAFAESNCHLMEISNWPAVEDHNVVIVGRVDELGTLPVALEIKTNLDALGPGRGLLAEFIVGDAGNRHRWILVTGGDDAGLEKAVVTLGSRPALDALPPSPAEIVDVPSIRPETEALSRPSSARTTFAQLRWGDFDVGQEPVARFGWRLPPSHRLERGELTLRFFHSTNVTNGALEVFLGAMRVGDVPLTHENGDGGSAKLPIPPTEGIDPLMFTFRARADPLPRGGPIATVLSGSSLETIARPLDITGLEHLDTLLVRDSFLRRIAFVLPTPPSRSELRLVFDISMHLGRRLPSSPVLWPQVCAFDPSREQDDNATFQRCLHDRSALVLAPVSTWRYATPNGARLLIQQMSRGTVRIQGRRDDISDFEPSLALIQMLPAPWGTNEWLVTAGGWTNLDPATVKALVIHEAARGRLHGNMAAMDHLGRLASYESRKPAVQSFAQTVKEIIPRGLDVAQTQAHLRKIAARRERSRRLNRFLVWFGGVVVLGVILGRVTLEWDRDRRRRSAQRETPFKTAA
ncbi:MAG: cellulose biosynthesis cyclic di-GMP-binding regulatory protein BcsB [Verrucomicrobia subdivision 3 bacterium]|nr:cellulose biosynthesis cyclic di-GMP-binding regulatory protein BcsB [Limisphaerales bacterium]